MRKSRCSSGTCPASPNLKMMPHERGSWATHAILFQLSEVQSWPGAGRTVEPRGSSVTVHWEPLGESRHGSLQLIFKTAATDSPPSPPLASSHLIHNLRHLKVANHRLHKDQKALGMCSCPKCMRWSHTKENHPSGKHVCYSFWKTPHSGKLFIV